MTFGKQITQTIPMTHWERVFLTNTLSLPFTLCLLVFSKERDRMEDMFAVLNPSQMHWVIASSVVGVGISFSGWKLRNEVSATAFTLVGVGNKILSILANQAFFHDGTVMGTIALLLAVLAGLFYEDTPATPSSVKQVDLVEVNLELTASPSNTTPTQQ
jgi:hypothetical protein